MPRYHYTYSPRLARIIFWNRVKDYSARILLLICDLCLILGALYLGASLDSPEGTDLIGRIFISIFGA